ncbi:parathymosin isoform X2 [Pipistrellus kuhlii]|uniref:parathymosin isoform X2 n=1 Tax=Pipistrellus kuhlii TaxID=59472 RepID=UPI00174F1D8F|nr:parathymosin isoform X2 [Pipistrellus kuhlii]
MSEKSVEAAAELSAKDLKEKKEKVEEKASRKERKKEVVEVLRVRVGGWDHLAPSFRPSQCPGPLVVMVWEASSQLDQLSLLVPKGGGKRSRGGGRGNR